MGNNAWENPATEIQEEKPKTNLAPPLSSENEQIITELEDTIQLGKEAYTEHSTKKLLQFLLENNDQNLAPTYNSDTGYVYEKIDQILGEKISSQKILKILNRLARLDILQKSFYDSAASCPSCQSTTMTVHNRCPKCKSHHIFKSSLTEHIPCGFIGEQELYKQERCPKCGNYLTETDYRNMGRWYICRECGEKFEEPQVEYQCRKCSRLFKIEEAKTVEVSQYSLNPAKKMEVRQAVASIESTSNLLRALGFRVEMPGLSIGKQSGMWHQFSAIAKRQDGETETTIAIDHAVGEPEVQASPLIIYIYKISEVKVDLPIFIAIPRLNDAARKIAEGRNILLIEGIPTSATALSQLRSQIEERLAGHGQEINQEKNNKGESWKRPLLKREEQKPALIDIIPWIHPKQQFDETKDSSFVNSLKKTFSKDKHEQNAESTL